MYTDLFLALLDDHNPRGHPILTALLYAFCPAAVRWHLAGAEPVLPFDPLWQAMSDLEKGETLKAALLRYGFADVLEAARSYVDEVTAYRDLHPGVIAPETSPFFPGGRLELAQRFGLGEAIKHLGGDWQNFYAYIHAWAFTLPDWEKKMHFSGAAEFSFAALMLILPGVRRAVRYRLPFWTARKGHAMRLVIGVPVTGCEQDQLRFSLMQRAGLEGDKALPRSPEVWAVDCSGFAEVFDSRLPDEALPNLIGSLAKAAGESFHLPMNALQTPSRCRWCGYQAQCYAKGELTMLALREQG